jgi:DNA-directed RNA polymerase specialized sigma24 family protein
MKYSEIALMLGRDERTIWTAYRKASGKMKMIMENGASRMAIPLLIFENSKFSVLELTVRYLRGKGMKYSEIASALGRDESNVRKLCVEKNDKIKRALNG